MKLIRKIAEKQTIMCILGAFVYSVSVVYFVDPVNIYNGGFMGIAQLISLLFENTPLAAFNVEGVIYFILNVPMLIIGLVTLGKRFMFTSILTTVAESAFVALLPAPAAPIMSDVLVNCVIGGCLGGLGSALTFIAFSSGGGTDILGILICKKFPKISVGAVSVIINIIVYGISALLFSLEVAIMSFIVSLCSSLVIDKLHLQRKSVAVNILSKEYETVKEYILNTLDRDATISTCIGAYSNEERHLVISIMSEYEMKELEAFVHDLDKNAFIFTNQVNVIGDFERRFSK